MFDEKYLNELLLEEKFKEAVEYCSGLIESGSNTSEVLCARSKALSNLEKYELSIIDATTAINISPNYAAAFFSRGKAYFGLLKFEDAIADFEKAIILGLNAKYELGLVYFYIKNHEKAIILLTEAIGKDRDIDVYDARSSVYYELNLYELGHEDIGKILLTYTNESNGLYDELLCFYKEITNNSDINPIINSLCLDVNTEKVLIDNGFLNHQDNFILSSKSQKMIGVYVLEFENKEKYVGQSTDFSKRLVKHYKTYDDIVNIYFKRIESVENLINEENFFIELLEKSGHRIRNLKQISFKSIFNESHQQKWLNEITYQYNTLQDTKGKNIKDDELDRFEKLKSKPYYQDFLRVANLYIKNAIPNFSASEYNYWNISCMPKYLLKDKWISRININNIPVFSIRESSNSELELMLFVSMLPYCSYLKEKNSFDSQFNQISSLRFEIRESFSDADNEEITLLVNARDFNCFIENEIILQSIRMFNLRMMNKIGLSKTFRRTPSHNGLLASAIQEYM